MSEKVIEDQELIVDEGLEDVSADIPEDQETDENNPAQSAVNEDEGPEKEEEEIEEQIPAWAQRMEQKLTALEKGQRKQKALSAQTQSQMEAGRSKEPQNQQEEQEPQKQLSPREMAKARRKRRIL